VTFARWIFDLNTLSLIAASLVGDMAASERLVHLLDASQDTIPSGPRKPQLL
jgi:hypothetical protein